MAISIQNRLKSLEEQRKKAEQGEHDELSEHIATYERKACLLLAWSRHHEGEAVASVLPDMLRHVEENEARRLLAMDYDSMYQAVGMPAYAAPAMAPKSISERPVTHQIRMPGERHGNQ